MAEAMLEVTGLGKTFGGRSGFLSRRDTHLVRAVRDVSFRLMAGESVGIVGESGSGKTTVAKMLVGLEAPSEGTIELEGEQLSGSPTTGERRARARALQIVFQDPYTSLDPRQTIADMLAEVQDVHFDRTDAEAEARTAQLLEAVGLSERVGRSFPRELSGGQRQRVAIARALAAEPRALILDEAVSALDVSVQAQILNLLAELRNEFDLTYLLISHDLAVVRQLSDRVLVMYAGRIVESGPVETILSSPRHPYTQRLISSSPHSGMRSQERAVVEEEPSPGECSFRSRCGSAFDRCLQEPELHPVDDAHEAACWLVDQPKGTRGRRGR